MPNYPDKELCLNLDENYPNRRFRAWATRVSMLRINIRFCRRSDLGLVRVIRPQRHHRPEVPVSCLNWVHVAGWLIIHVAWYAGSA